MTTDRRGPRWVGIVPNVLSAARLMLAGAFPFCPRESWPWLIIAGGLTDLIDGMIARRFGATSWAGGVLDAVADKTFALVVLVSLTAAGSLAVWQTLLLLTRDMAVLMLAMLAAIRRRWQLTAHRPLGRYTTAAVFVLLFCLAAWPEQHELNLTLFVLAAGLSVLAAGDYLVVTFGRGSAVPVDHDDERMPP